MTAAQTLVAAVAARADGFERESFGLRLRHDAAGLLSMVTKHGTNQSRFAPRTTNLATGVAPSGALES